ncbi:AAA family ATPase [Tolypothrix campylonemoides VB511288]|nr:AAA family ATPase [Tolypothrix campylonemoides VB511288]
MNNKGRHLSWKAGKENARILVEALHSLADGDLDNLDDFSYFETTVKHHWEETNLWVTKTTLRHLSNLTDKRGQKVEPEQIRNALHCLEALGILEDKRRASNSKTITGTREWCFVLKLLNGDKQENLDRLFGKRGEEGEWERRRNNGYQVTKSKKHQKVPLPQSLVIPPCPYRGLLAFQEEDSEFFFGRDTFVEQLVTAVRKKPLVPVIGRSGSGKSSVVFAGLIPKLRQEGGWLIRDFRPENRPFYNLAKKLNSLLIPQWETMSNNEQRHETRILANNLWRGVDSLQDVVADILQDNHCNHRLLLVVDQLEELYTISPEDERQPFLNQLLRAVRIASARQTPNFIVVLTLRDDFLGQALDYPLGNALQEFKPELLCPMTRKELQEAIEKPAAKQKVTIEECLTERILDAVVGQPGILPCLEFALTQLWEKQRNCLLNHSAYKEIGGVEKALANHADQVFEALNEQDQQRVKRIFIQLVNFEEKKQDTRRLATCTQVGKDNWDLVKHLADKRLVVTGRDEATKEETVEVVHEALIRGWDHLDQWMEENHKFRTWQERLRDAIERWEAINRDDGGLLQKALLAEAEDWIEKRGDEITPDEKAFIRKSREYEDRGRKLQEELRRQAEISEINTLVQLSQKQILLHDQLDALVNAVQAGIKLQRTQAPTDDIKRATVYGLRQAIYDIQERNRFQGHTNKVNDVNFSSDGRMIASASHDKTVKLWQIDGTLQQTFPHSDWVYGVSVSPDGQMIASACADTIVRLWHINGKLLQSFEGHSKMVNKVSFSPDGQIVTSASDDKTVKLWQLDGTLLQTLQHSDMAYGVIFSPDGQMLAEASLDQMVRLWHIDGTLLHTFEGHTESVNRVSFSPDGQMIASASDDHTVKLWRIDGTLLQTFFGHSDVVNTVSFSPDSQKIASASSDKTIKLWRIDGTLLQTFQGHDDKIYGISFSPDGNIIASASDDKTVRLWRIDGTTFAGHTDKVWSVSFSPDGQTLASGSWDRTVRLWQLDGTPLRIFRRHSDRVFNVTFSPDGKTIASASDDTTVKLWSIEGTELQTFRGHTNRVYGVSFSPDGQIIATSSHDTTVRLWHINGEPLQIFEGHSDWVYGVNFSPDGQMIASASHDKTVRLWHIDGTHLKTIEGHSDRVWSVSFSPQGGMIASASFDATVKLWRIDGTLVETLQHSDIVNKVSFSPDGQMIASASNDKTVKLWALDGTLLQTFQGHTDRVLGVNFSPDGKTIASCGEDKTVRIWQLDGTEGILDLDAQLDNLLVRGCNWLRDYLKTSPNVSESDRLLCDGIDNAQ